MSEGIRIRRGYRVPFAQIPEALLDDTRVSDRGVRLWARIDRYAGQDGGAYPSRLTLANKLGVSVDTLDRAVRDLERSGWMRVERRPGATSVYVLLNPFEDVVPSSRKSAAPPDPTTSRTVAATSSRRSAAQNESQENESPPQPPKGGVWRPEKVDGKSVTAAERELCDAILEAFNEIAGTNYRGTAGHRRAIVSRIREAEGLPLASHRRIIEVAFERPWWRERDPEAVASPRVIYGNETVFEEARVRTRAARQGPRQLTPEQEAQARHARHRAAAEQQHRDAVAWWRTAAANGDATAEEAERQIAALEAAYREEHHDVAA